MFEDHVNIIVHGHEPVLSEMIKNDVLELTTGCNGIVCAMEDPLTPEAAEVHCGPGLAEVCETMGLPLCNELTNYHIKLFSGRFFLDYFSHRMRQY